MLDETDIVVPGMALLLVGANCSCTCGPNGDGGLAPLLSKTKLPERFPMKGLSKHYP